MCSFQLQASVGWSFIYKSTFLPQIWAAVPHICQPCLWCHWCRLLSPKYQHSQYVFKRLIFSPLNGAWTRVKNCCVYVCSFLSYWYTIFLQFGSPWTVLCWGIYWVSGCWVKTFDRKSTYNFLNCVCKKFIWNFHHKKNTNVVESCGQILPCVTSISKFEYFYHGCLYSLRH